MNGLTKTPFPMLIDLVDDDGNTREHVGIVIFPAGDRLYIAMAPTDEITDGVEVEIVFLRYTIDGGSDEIENIESDAEWELVIQAFAVVGAKMWPDDESIPVEGQAPLDLTAHRPN
jgi:hypothetical protein